MTLEERILKRIAGLNMFMQTSDNGFLKAVAEIIRDEYKNLLNEVDIPQENIENSFPYGKD